MTKRKVLMFAAILAVAGVAVVLCERPKSDVREDSVARDSGVPVVQAASVAKPCPALAAAVSVTNQTPTVRGTLPYVLTSKKPIQKSLRLAVEALGARTVCLLSRNTMLVEADAATRARLTGDSRFEDVEEYVSSSKVQPELAAMIADGAKSVDVSLVSLAAEDRELVISCLKAGGGEMLQGCINEGDTIRAKLPAALVAELASRGDVRWMEKFEYPQFMNDQAIQPEAMNVTNVWDMSHGLGLTGAGQVISTSDSGIDTGDLATIHEDLRDRVLERRVVEGASPTDINGHGTHTAGSIVGTGKMSDGRYRGTAHGAHLYAWFCAGIKDTRQVYMPSTLEALYTANGDWTNFIHSASWGDSTVGQYNTKCKNHDEYVWKHPDYLPVFSAGNDGSAGRCTIGSPAAAKNVLAVGATMNRPTGDPFFTASFSSRGPCKDGRIKPDIAAPGWYVTSTRSSMTSGSGYYTQMRGTSMSCPLTAGSVALVRQWLIEKRGFEDEDGKRPTAALMKAVIMGGAKDVKTPNNSQGWGRVDLADTLAPTNGCAVKLVDRIPFAQDFVTNIVIETTNAAPLDVQLVWVDYPGNPSGVQAAPRLINDLDLTVESRILGEPTVRYGNGGDAPDTLNNAESVRIDSAKPSTYVITVRCKNIPYDHTDGGAAALYIRGAFDPDAEVDMPVYVRLKKQDAGFMSLDRALAAVRDDDETVEILDWVSLDKSVTLTNSCTILATNVDAAASYVLRPNDSALTVTNATVTLSNVVFSASTEALVAVEAGGRLKLGPKVDMGLDVYHVAVTTADADGFELAGELTRKVLLHCDAATRAGKRFGLHTCDPAIATNCAVMIVCEDDIDRETRGGVGPDATLVWTTAVVPMSEAAGYYVDGEGYTNTYFRMEKALNRFKKDYKDGMASEFVALKSGDFLLPFAVGAPLTLRGEGVPRPVFAVANTADFQVVEGGSLTFSNLVFSGYVDQNAKDKRGFIEVNGGTLTLDDGAELNDITGTVSYGSGVIDLKLGTVNVLPGAAIVNCEAKGGSDGHGYGGAIYTYYDTNCVLNLMGGTITNCLANLGGGIYVDCWASKNQSAKVNVSGPLVVSDNRAGNASSRKVDNIYLPFDNARARFVLKGRLHDSSVGIKYGGTTTGNALGEAFVMNAAGVLDNATLKSFVNDANEGLEATTNAANDRLVWKQRVDDGQCCPSKAVAHLVDAAGQTNYFASVERAFAYMGTRSPYVVEMQRPDCLSNTVTVLAGRTVTLRSRNGSKKTLTRDGDYGFVVPTGSSLVLTNVCISGDGDSEAYGEWMGGGNAMRSKPFFDVSGGRLTLKADATVANVVGYGNRASGAATVYAGGSFDMYDGALIDTCENLYQSKESAADYSVGAGVLVDGWQDKDTKTVARLRGGTIRDCQASRGGAVYVSNGAEVYVSGTTCVEIDEPDRYNNFVVDDSATLTLDGAATGEFNMAESVVSPTHDTNYIGRITGAWKSDLVALTNSAARFVHCTSGDLGTAVTNRTDANDVLLVWCGAVRGGKLYARGGKVYAPVADVSCLVPVPPAPAPEPAPLSALPAGATEDEVAEALDAAGLRDPSVAINIMTVDEYNEFCAWAKDVGVEDVMASDHAYVSYQFGLDGLFENEPAVEIAEVQTNAGGLSVSVIVKDGDDPVLVATEAVKNMFEATSDLGAWDSAAKAVDLAVGTSTVNADKSMTFTVVPAGSPATVFLRLKY